MMKFAGMIILIFSSAATGILLVINLKKRVEICSEIISLCDLLLLDLGYRITPAKELLDKTLLNEKTTHLSFISSQNIIEKKPVKSLLSKSENDELSEFLFSLGKTDVSTQKKLIETYKESINFSLENYREKLARDSKLYLSFSLFFSLVFCLVWS